MKKFFIPLAAMALTMPMMAAEPEGNTSEFMSEEPLESGFLTTYLNNAIASSMESAPAAAEKKELQYGRNVTDFISAPKFGGYVIGRYQYSDKDGAKGGPGFNQRLVRFYIDGTILKDFAYRIQIQTNNDGFHMKDFFVEWKKYSYFKVKIGQFKRAFGFENPMNPWDISTGDYSLMTKYLTGHNDYLGADTKGGTNGGRDMGLQVQGDFMPVGEDNHNLFHYQLMVSNGTGINCNDTDGKKDITGTFQVQPVKGLFLGFFGWKGTFDKANAAGVVENHSRNRYAFGAKYDDKSGMSFRTEYAHGQSDLGNCEAFYAVAGMPLNDWFKLTGQYQWANNEMKQQKQTVLSLIPEFQLHKNLKFQIQYNYNIMGSHATGDKHFNELWLETYFRF
ncbi:MAG: porin [Bacteroidales bacterium]|nr:porin [Bacteroidales bacterium]